MDANNGTRLWQLNAWYANNYPEKVGVFKDRIWFARDEDRWATVQGDIYTFSPTLPDADDLWSSSADAGIAIKSTEALASRPTWIVGNKVLHVGTTGNHSVVQGDSQYGPITPQNVSLVSQGGIPTADIMPIIMNALYFIDASRQHLYKTDFDYLKSSYVAEQLTQYNTEILYPRVASMALVTQPFNMIWCVLENGDVAVCTINEVDGIYSWSKLTYTGFIIDVCVTRNADNREEIYLLDSLGKVLEVGSLVVAAGSSYISLDYTDVLQSVGGIDMYHTTTGNYEKEIMMDFATFYDGVSNPTFDLSTLDTDEALVVIPTTTPGRYDVYKQQDRVLNFTGGEYQVGTVFEGFFKTNLINRTIQGVTDLGQTRKASGLGVNMFKTGEFKYKDYTNPKAKYKTFTKRTSASELEDAPNVHTGYESLKFNTTASDTIGIEIKKTLPVPVNILSIVTDQEIDGPSR